MQIAGTAENFLWIHGVKLTREQEEEYKAAFLESIRRKGELEAAVAVVDSMQDGILTVKIPVYPEQGEQLRKDFYAKLAYDLPPEKYAEVMEKVSGDFDRWFAGFGKDYQAYAVTRLDDGRLRLTAELMVAQPGAPAIIGDGGTPAGVGNTFSSSSIFSRDELPFGFYSALVPSVDRYFPTGAAK